MFATMLCAVPWWAQGFAILFIAVCLVLIALVLLQKGRGGGLTAAFGGEGGQSAFGSKTGDVFTWVTIVVVVAFFLIAVLLSLGYKPASLDETIDAGPGLGTPATSEPVETGTPATEADDEDAATDADVDSEESADGEAAVTEETVEDGAAAEDEPATADVPEETEATETE